MHSNMRRMIEVILFAIVLMAHARSKGLAVALIDALVSRTSDSLFGLVFEASTLRYPDEDDTTLGALGHFAASACKNCFCVKPRVSTRIAEPFLLRGESRRDCDMICAMRCVEDLQPEPGHAASQPLGRRHASLAATIGALILGREKVAAAAYPRWWPGGAFGLKEQPKRGMEMIGWHGKSLNVPFGISNSPVTKVLQSPKWPTEWPYIDEDFNRFDESSDTSFYDEPRFVQHIDDGAIKSIRDFYDLQFALAPPGEYSVLDMCSSWISHYPESLRAKRVAITGINKQELEANKQATEYAAKDLNVDPSLPYGDNEFDFLTNVVSVDYLIKPRSIFNEMHRVLKPGGVAIISFSNRFFASKSIAEWARNIENGPNLIEIVGNYFYFNPDSGWRDISSVDISMDPEKTDPMWVVTAVKA